MFATDAALFLPISDRLLGPVLDPAGALDPAIAGLNAPQIASLLLLQYLPRMNGHPSLSAERVLLETLDIATAQVQQEGLPALVTSALKVLDREQIRQGYQLLPDLRIALLDDEALVHKSYLTADGRWDPEFPGRHRARLMESLQRVELPTGEHRLLTSEQSRIFRELRAQDDDHLHVQGYAGSGKSSLIKSFVALLRPKGARILVLAERRTQLGAILDGVDNLEGVYPRTFDKLMDEVVPKDLTVLAHRRMRRTDFSVTQMSDDAVAKHLGVHSYGNFSARDIVQAVRRTVQRFCRSGEQEIDVCHLPSLQAVVFDDTTRQLVLHHATEFWHTIVSPQSREFQPQVRSYHRIKWAALNAWRVPAHYTHVLIDECHDLTTAMLQILDGSPQAVISLGDEYQNLHGRPQRRSNVSRLREVTRSVRSGKLIEGIVNPIIASHPGGTKSAFQGNQLARTEVVYYGKPEIPEKPAVILVMDLWGLFEWAQRLSAAGVDFDLLGSRSDLNVFVADCVELYKHGTRPRHPQLFRFGSWDALANHQHDNPGFQRIDRMLRKGYSTGDWDNAAKKLATRSTQAVPGYALGLIENARNQEFDTVMLASDAWSASAASWSALYVAVTRARHRLIVPERLRSWVEDLPTMSSFAAGWN